MKPKWRLVQRDPPFRTISIDSTSTSSTGLDVIGSTGQHPSDPLRDELACGKDNQEVEQWMRWCMKNLLFWGSTLLKWMFCFCGEVIYVYSILVVCCKFWLCFKVVLETGWEVFWGSSTYEVLTPLRSVIVMVYLYEWLLVLHCYTVILMYCIGKFLHTLSKWWFTIHVGGTLEKLSEKTDIYKG